MALKAIVDSLDDIPADIHGEYVERNGKFELQVEGMKTEADVARVQTALTKERTDHGALKQRVGLLGDRKIEDVVPLLDRIPELEAAAAGKIDDVAIERIVESRLNTKLAPIVRERDQLKTQLTEAQGTILDFTGKERTRTIHDQVRQAAARAKLLPEAIDDALALADRTFEIEDGTDKVVTKDKVGVTPGLEPSAWLTDLMDKKPHWWGPTLGGGADGHRGGGSDSRANPFTAENWNLTEQGSLYKTNPAKATQLAQAAGTTVGGPKPAPRK
jgi:hypothetical protein